MEKKNISFNLIVLSFAVLAFASFVSGCRTAPVKDAEPETEEEIIEKITAEAEKEMQNGQKLYKKSGMERSAVILSSAVVTMQFKRIAQETGIYQWERYIDASKVANWEEVAKKWLVNAEDPDK